MYSVTLSKLIRKNCELQPLKTQIKAFDYKNTWSIISSIIIIFINSLALMDPAENTHPQHQHFVDAVELACPLPLLKMKQALNKAEEGEVIFVKATDPASKRDFESFINMTNHKMVSKVSGSVFEYWITKA